MMPVANAGAGANAGFPDVCLTPPLVPYPNVGLNATATGYSPNLFIGFLPAFHLATVIPQTLADEPGALHPLHKDFSAYVAGNPQIFHNCLPAIHLMCPTIGNGGNCTSHLVAVPSVTVTLYNDAGRPEGTVDGNALRALSAAIEGDHATVTSTEGDGERTVTIRRFTRDIGTRFFNALHGHESDEPLTIDLRGCPGGDAEAALALAAELVPRGTPLARLYDHEDLEGELLIARSSQAYFMPLTLLVDRATASAAELFAAALQAAGRARVVGRRTAGKDTAQRIVAGAEGPLYVTVARFTRADGSSLSDGVEPNG